MTRLEPKQAAAYIGCGYDKLMQMVRKGTIPHYRVGNRALFIQEKLDEWISDQMTQSIDKKVVG